MCTKIECENVVASYFKNSNDNELSFKKLNSIRREIESENKNFFVDVSYSAIRKTAIKFQEYIEVENNGIHRINKKTWNPKSDSLDESCVRIIMNNSESL